jgi:hypothetical protein
MSDIPLLGQREQKKDDPQFRLLQCFVCDTLEELPPYDGPAEQDHLLAIACETHVFPSGEPHKGKLYSLPLRAWANYESKKEIIRQIKGGGSKGLDEFDDKFYESRSTFMEDAMKCYQAHNKPTTGCSDYRDSKLRLVPNTIKDRKAAGMENYLDAPGPKTYRCDFCPVSVIVNQRKQSLMKGVRP